MTICHSEFKYYNKLRCKITVPHYGACKRESEYSDLELQWPGIGKREELRILKSQDFSEMEQRYLILFK